MPYEVKRDSRCPKSKPFGVMKKGGGDLHGCHPSMAAGRKQQAALYMAESKKEAETVEPEIEEKATDGAGEAEVKMVGMPHHYVPYGVTSFSALQAAREADEATMEVSSLAGDLQGLLGNRIGQIMMDETIGNDQKAPAIVASLKELAEELAGVVQEEVGMEHGEEKAASDEAGLFQRFRDWLKAIPTKSAADGAKHPASDSGFMLWKEADGTYRWMARYSNNFRDQDNPPEIISADSHKHFVQMVDTKEADYPDLWLWHRPEWRWGKATWLSYDDAGFALAAGTVDHGKESVAEHLMALDPALVRVSHGMPTKSIVRDTQDESVIVRHVTREISPLPAWAAANQLTGFTILKEATDMAIPQDKRDALKTEWNLTDELLTQLEAANVEQAKAADQAGIEKKEKEVETAETTAAPTEPVAEAPAETPEAEPSVTRAELAGALTAIGQAISALTEQVKELQGQVVEVKETKSVEEAATLSEIFERAIRHPDTRVDGRTTAAKDRPAETKAEKPGVINTGNPLADGVINSIVSGDWLKQLQAGQDQPH